MMAVLLTMNKDPLSKFPSVEELSGALGDATLKNETGIKDEPSNNVHSIFRSCKTYDKIVGSTFKVLMLLQLKVLQNSL